jgi:hypothetical protein
MRSRAQPAQTLSEIVPPPCSGAPPIALPRSSAFTKVT